MNFAVIYVSKTKHAFTNAELRALADKANSSNSKLDVTGLLLYSGKYFLQILEGDYDTVNTLFTKIKSDSRHNEVIILMGNPATKRLFPEWSMGVVDVRLSEPRDAELFERICTQSYESVNEAAIEALKLFKRKQADGENTQAA